MKCSEVDVMTTTTLSKYSAQQEAQGNIENAILGHTYALCEALRQNFIEYSIKSHALATEGIDYHNECIAQLKQGICDYDFYPETGKKYHKVIMSVRGSRSVHCFIDKKTGEVYKSASWKSPAKGVRYNLTIDEQREYLLQHADWAGSYLYAR
jgi:hypothetical protein